MLEFAESELVLGTGPYKGQRFNSARQPFTRLLLNELSSDRWTEAYVCGPSQSSKTLCACVAPTLYTIAELRENVVFGVPQDDMCDDKWRTDIQPMMVASPRLRRLLPVRGPGSQGGRVRDSVEFTNGVVMKVMTRGSEDTGKAGFTARRVHVTEAAGWSKGTITSDSADPLRQLRARQRGYPRYMRRLIVEGTLTIAEQLPYRARGEDDDDRLISSRSRLMSPCPHCEAFICPGREHLLGWHNAANELQAAEQAAFFCPECNQRITDKQRRQSMRDVVLVHAGQEVIDGQVVGDMPPTSVLWFHWSVWHNMLLSVADIGVDEWVSAQLDPDSEDREQSERELTQFVWSVPYVEPQLLEMNLQPKAIRRRRSGTEMNVLPHNTTHLAMGIDLGKWTSWHVLIAGTGDNQFVLPAYGPFTVCSNEGDDVEPTLLNALREFRDNVIEPGFVIDGTGDRRVPEEVWIDAQWLSDVVRTFVVESNEVTHSRRYRVAHGRGHGQMGRFHEPKAKTRSIRHIGERYYLERNRKIPRVIEATFDADYWKLYVQRRVTTDKSKPGALHFYYSSAPNEHAQISHHYANEKYVRVAKEKRGMVNEWQKRGQNHLLDASAMACAAIHATGYRWREDVAQVPRRTMASWLSDQKKA